jgi:hypothetical protein
VDGWDVVDVRWREEGWGAGERRQYTLIPGRAYQVYKLHVTQVGGAERGVLAIAELELHRASQGGGAADSNFNCSLGEEWAAEDPSAVAEESDEEEEGAEAPPPPLPPPPPGGVDLSVDHTYSLDLRSDGVIDFLFDGDLVRSWADDTLEYGTLGVGNQCRQSTISAVTIHQLCEVTVHIHVEGKGADTRWNIDRLDDMTFEPDGTNTASDYAAVRSVGGNLGDHYHVFELTSGTHQFNAYPSSRRTAGAPATGRSPARLATSPSSLPRRSSAAAPRPTSTSLAARQRSRWRGMAA